MLLCFPCAASCVKLKVIYLECYFKEIRTSPLGCYHDVQHVGLFLPLMTKYSLPLTDWHNHHSPHTHTLPVPAGWLTQAMGDTNTFWSNGAFLLWKWRNKWVNNIMVSLFFLFLTLSSPSVYFQSFPPLMRNWSLVDGGGGRTSLFPAGLCLKECLGTVTPGRLYFVCAGLFSALHKISNVHWSRMADLIWHGVLSAWYLRKSLDLTDVLHFLFCLFSIL